MLTLKTLLITTSQFSEFNEREKVMLKILSTILDKNQSNSQRLSAKFVSEILWSLASAKLYDRSSLKKLEKSVIENIHEMNDIDVTQCFYAFCVFQNCSKRKSYGNVLDLLAERIQGMKRRLNKKSISLIEKGKKLANYELKI